MAKWLTASTCCNAPIKRETFANEAKVGNCTKCGHEVDRVENGEYRVTSGGCAPPIVLEAAKA